MNDQMPPAMDQPKRNNNTMIIAAVAVVLLCCCCIGVAALWQYGDAIVQALGM
jgi:hypothetical protein